MNIDDQQFPPQQSPPTNALAGPSTMPEVLPIYLAPPGPPRPRPLLASTQDLVTRFQLLPAYDKYVRPYAPPVGQPSAPVDKGKGKEKEMSVPLGATPRAEPDGEEEDGEGKKKAKNTYKQLIKGIPGKHSMKKDDYLMTTMQVPPKQKIRIAPFDQRTQREAFSVSLEGLKGWNINALVAESPQAREDRKKRKELKKLAKAQGQTPIVAGTPSGLPTTPAVAASLAAAAPVRTATPKPAGVPRPSASIPHANVNPSHPRGRTPVGIGTPQSMPTPGTAAIPTPAPTTAAFSPPVSTPGPASIPTATGAELKRGVKREREPTGDSARIATYKKGVSTANGNGAAAAPKPAMVVSAKAGNAGVRPRPLKKQRMDTEGATRPLPVQQPTPHA
ncbi:hypothetical protein DAEQUDRAFT_754388 [Daedalea quercina L-15889]|uniref:Mediator of RNA polymerase II transcription subunit 19 n=1 Tax=Daedalea quercina L-15889 TaxID=1314783 RepID=A0A165TJF5_9APHY|nr:hypothetical protein DAEQUDRAFT_754388 [Daedalea quercina L-15889]